MKTLVFFGSSRKKGHTKAMIDLFCEHLGGEIDIVDCYREKNISPCLDCRHCWESADCVIKDDMQKIYKKIDEANNIVLASPMYFHSVPGPMKSILDRLQVYWAGHIMRKDAPPSDIRHGAILMVGGAPSFPNQFEGGGIVLRGILGDLSSDNLGMVCFPNSDKDSIETMVDLKEEIISLANKMKEANKE